MRWGWLFVLGLLLCGCVGKPDNQQLIILSEDVADNPRAVLDALCSIDTSRFTEADRHFRDFLLIKGSDLAYITHESDSLVIDVIEYYRKHNWNNIYPEALYYGGRVYSDLHDYPTALSYFQQALDLLPPGDSDNALRCRVLSQTGRLLNTVRMYDQAEPYLREALKIDIEASDTFGIAYGHLLLGVNYFELKEYDKAAPHFDKALHWTSFLDPEDVALVNSYRAVAEYKKGDIKKALSLMRGMPELTDSLTKGLVLGYASEIYLKAGITDSAFMYARELASMDGNSNRRIGLGVMLNEKLRHFLPADSFYAYNVKYNSAIEDLFNQYEADGVKLQNAYFNYDLHVREKLKSDKRSTTLQNILYVVTLILLVLTIILIVTRYKNRVLRLNLKLAISDLNALQTYIAKDALCEVIEDNVDDNGEGAIPMEDGPVSCNDDDLKTAVPVAVGNAMAGDNRSNKESLDSLRDDFREKLKSLLKHSKQDYKVPDEITCSGAYCKLKELVENDRFVKDDDPLWVELEKVVLKVSPRFKENLDLLTGGISMSGYHLALLVKCGIKSKDMMTLFAKEKGTVSYYRRQLCDSILGGKNSSRILEGIIYLL